MTAMDEEKFLLNEIAGYSEQVAHLTEFIERTVPVQNDIAPLTCLLDGVVTAAREQGRVLQMLEPYGIEDVQTALIRNLQNHERDCR